VPNFSCDIDGEQYQVNYHVDPTELSAYGFHIEELLPLNNKAVKTGWPYHQNRDKLNRQIPLSKCEIHCHVCGCRVHSLDNHRGDYYYCRDCMREYEKNPSVCPFCACRLMSDWDGPYCVGCGRHYYKVDH
jgi:ribosomal protein S14